ncbi:MAG: AraC family transcriptional regulator [Nannocystaceae bacterium]|nr:AraC family transcriptional regulator [Nannocystaceae bacterium]
MPVPIGEPARVRFWRPDTPAVDTMVRVDREHRTRVTCSEAFMVVVVLEGAYDGWYRGRVHAHVAGSVKLKEPGEVHRGVRVHVPFSIQGAAIAAELVTAAAAAMGVRGTPHFRAAALAPGAPASRLAFALHDALVRPDAPPLERSSRVAELLAAVVGGDAPPTNATRSVQRARAFLRECLAETITLDGLARHARLDKFHLVRAFRAELGVPPYEYLTHLRIARARELLRKGVRVAAAAQQVGLYDESQLHRHFKRIVGIAPGAFARSVAPGSRGQHRPRPHGRGAASCGHGHD